MPRAEPGLLRVTTANLRAPYFIKNYDSERLFIIVSQYSCLETHPGLQKSFPPPFYTLQQLHPPVIELFRSRRLPSAAVCFAAKTQVMGLKGLVLQGGLRNDSYVFCGLGFAVTIHSERGTK